MKVVFDSGSTYTHFDRQTYKATEKEVYLKNSALSCPCIRTQISSIQVWILQVIGSLDRSLTKVPDDAFKLCWKGAKKFKSVDDVKSLFKPIFLIFRRDDAKGSKAPWIFLQKTISLL